MHAPGLKTIDDALEVRGRIFGAFELAEVEQDGETAGCVADDRGHRGGTYRCRSRRSDR